MEDAYFWGIIVRSLERVIAVVFGGMAIYFGYRLFQLLPTQKDSSGKIELPGISVVLSKAGPGVFFVAFGAVILLAAFFKPVVVKDPHGGSYSGLGPNAPLVKGVSEQDFVRARLAIQVLNCIEKEHNVEKSSIKEDDLSVSVTDAKLALLAGSWDQEKWGEYSVFYSKLLSGGLGDEQTVLKIFNEVLPGC